MAKLEFVVFVVKIDKLKGTLFCGSRNNPRLSPLSHSSFMVHFVCERLKIVV